jgi:outer membrane protein OmpA-like peptidoglycan-associated protein
MRRAMRGPISVVCLLTVWCAAVTARAESGEIPLTPGMNFVLAVENRTGSLQPGGPTGILQGDYEMVVTISSIDDQGIHHIALFDGFDEAGVHRRVTVPRLLTPGDLAGARVHVWGFHSSDPLTLDGTSALGPSLAVLRELRDRGTTTYSFMSFAGRPLISGTLTRSTPAHVKFPVLINGRRVELDGLAARGQMGDDNARRPFETVILDHPRYPISLRLAYGPRDAGFPFKPDFVREVVRIDFPEKQSVLAQTLEKECRVEVPGIYFDFNRATIKPESEPALKEMAAALLAQPRRAIRIEGHTDNIGSDSYNDDLSLRRANAVKETLVRDFGVNESMLSTIGYGERRPLESNDTLAGRARNRRVELVCAGSE